MSSRSCKLYPEAPNGQRSILFEELQARTHDRESAKNLWAFTQTPLFKESFRDLTLDKNGEPTYESVARALQLDEIFSKTDQDRNRALDMGIMNRSGQPVKFDSPSVAMTRAEEFNDSAQRLVAVPQMDEDGKAIIQLDDNTPLSVAEADRNRARRQLNKLLIGLLQRNGFNMEFVEDPDYAALFNPLFAEDNANNLRIVIRAAKNEQGLDAIPEEVSHLIIAGMKNHVLKQRADALFTDEVVRQVLGDEYEEYRKRYAKGRTALEDRLREEAEGKVLASLLKGEPLEVPKAKQSGIRSIMQRIWNWVKEQVFGKMSEETIDDLVAHARSSMQSIADLVESGEVDTVLDKDLIMAHDEMYALERETENLSDIAIKGEALLAQRLKILEESEGKVDSKALRRQIKNARRALESQKYESACYTILTSIGKEVTDLMAQAKKIGGIHNGSTDLNVICAEADTVERMGVAVQAYMEYLKQLEDLSFLVKEGLIEMDEDWVQPIVEQATKFRHQLENLNKQYGQLRYSVLRSLVSLFYGINGEKPATFEENNTYKWESVDTILSKMNDDIGMMDTTVFSAGDSRSPLINVLHRIVVEQQAKRDNRIYKAIAKLQEAEEKLQKAGYENKFVCQFDEEGVATGYYVSDRDWIKYNQDREAFVQSLENLELDAFQYKQRLDEWEKDHLEDVEVGTPKGLKGERRVEQMPSKKYYEIKNFQKGWSQEQKDYYKAVLDMKAEMDGILPGNSQCLYKMPQVRKSVSQMFDKDGKGALKTIWSKWKSKIAITDDNDQYGTRDKEITDAIGAKYKLVELDFAKKLKKKVPIYFIHDMQDKRDLSTDATHAMCNYVAMAINYSEMGKLAGAMRLMQEHVKSDQFEVVQREGKRPMLEAFTSLGKTYFREYRKSGFETRTAKAASDYIDRLIFNETKAKQGKLQIGRKEVDKDALYNAFMDLTSKSRLGINILSGITNVTQGETQMINEAASGKTWTIKDLARAKKEYLALMPDYLGQFNSVNRHDKMYMLINQFNSSEDFFRDMKDKDFNKSAYKRVMGRGNIYLFNTIGEHYLHTSGMLAILYHEKVKRKSDPNKVVSLYDVIKQVHDKDGWHLELDDDIEFVDTKRAFLQNSYFKGKGEVKKSDRDALFEHINMYVNNINSSLHGGYSEAEKGNINRTFAGRLIMQFRQWMPGMYNRLYSREYYDAVRQERRVGGYNSMWKWFNGMWVDMKSMSFKLALEHNKLSQQEKTNVRTAMAQAGMAFFLTLLSGLTAGWKDKDDRAIRLLAYSIRRLEMETNALSIANPYAFMRNILTLVQSPAAGVKTIETVSQMLDFASMGQFIQSGRFKGWWKPAKSFWTLTPLYNIQRLIDMDDYSYMFNIFANS